jgi:hypothetical protein
MGILNLNEFVSEEKVIKLDGIEYKVPRISVENMLELVKYSQETEKDNLQINKVLQKIWDILAIENPKADKKRFLNFITIEMLKPLIEFLMQSQTPKAIEQESKNGSGA